MIKNYKQFESLLDKLQGPSDDEVKKNIIEMSNPDNQLKASIDIEYIDGIKYALENGANTDYVYYENVIKLIKLLDMSDSDIKDMMKSMSKSKVFIVLIALGKINLIENIIDIDGHTIHSQDDLPIRDASKNNDYKSIEYLFTLDDFKFEVLRICWLDAKDEKIRNLIHYHMDNRQLHSLKHMCKIGDFDVVKMMLRTCQLTNDGIEECISVTTDEDIKELLENCIR